MMYGDNNRIQALEQALAFELAREAEKQALLEKFGRDEDYPVESVIAWQRTFGRTTNIYDYVAIKTRAGWFVTGRACASGISKPWTWIVENQLQHAVAEDREVWIVANWEKLT
jgi:hypothetical protein